jgi:hypothetical protein
MVGGRSSPTPTPARSVCSDVPIVSEWCHVVQSSSSRCHGARHGGPPSGLRLRRFRLRVGGDLLDDVGIPDTGDDPHHLPQVRQVSISSQNCLTLVPFWDNLELDHRRFSDPVSLTDLDELTRGQVPE